MKKVILDTKLNKRFEEARKILVNYRKMLEKQIPEGWKIETLMFPIQYEKTIKIGKKKYIGYLRSRWKFPFSIEIYEKGRKFKLKEIIFSHKPVDKADDDPPLKSMKIIDRQLEKMKRASINLKIK